MSFSKIGITEILPGTDIVREEAECVRLNAGEAQPSDLNSNVEGRLSWEQWYRLLWEYKVLVWDKNHRRVF